MEKIDFNKFIIIIDKPAGPTSFEVTDFVRKKFNLNKAAHAGTLDPEVTGVLPILLGRASKLLDYFIHRDKTYMGIMHFHEEINKKEVEDAIKLKFSGKIMQLPPVKSRVKRQVREREIKKFEIIEQDGKDFLFEVVCEAGTYIRKLVHDLGEELGIGAHMTELRRTNASIFNEKEAVTLYSLEEALEEHEKGNNEKIMKMIVPIEIITKVMPKISVKKEYLGRILHGSPIFNKMLEEHEDFQSSQPIALFHDGNLLGVFMAEISSKSLEYFGDERLIAVPRTIFN
ncbi:MAG: RNA-guided pseudouridylation complex pseudouridine synthase subunit Cbf5 [archaeon]